MKPQEINQAIAERRNHYYDGLKESESIPVTEDEKIEKRKKEIREFIKKLSTGQA